jgi:antitoxin (DNA-binding transcriptional repressor) of toxin-antitoxin stability system
MSPDADGADGRAGAVFLVATLVGTAAKGTVMRRVGIREFKNQATALLSAGETLVIERHGTPIGFFVPIEAKDRAAGRDALGRLGRTVAVVLAQTGMDENQLVKEVSEAGQ